MAKTPRTVTLIQTGSASGDVYRLYSTGELNYRAAYLHADGTEGQPYLMTKSRYTLLEGEHRDLLTHLASLEAGYRQAVTDYENEEARALRAYREQWQREHPRPTWPDMNKVVLDYMVTRTVA